MSAWLSNSWVALAVGVLLILAGASFAWKFVQASVFGRVRYWSGFLPLTILSPLFVHLPTGQRSLVRTTHGLWIHVIMGPFFLILSLLCLATGADLAGLPGTQSLNFVLNGGDTSKPPAVLYDKRFSLTFPMLARASRRVQDMMNTVQVPLSEKDRLLQVGSGGSQAYSEAEHKASSAH